MRRILIINKKWVIIRALRTRNQIFRETLRAIRLPQESTLQSASLQGPPFHRISRITSAKSIRDSTRNHPNRILSEVHPNSMVQNIMNRRFNRTSLWIKQCKWHCPLMLRSRIRLFSRKRLCFLSRIIFKDRLSNTRTRLTLLYHFLRLKLRSIW